MKGLTLNCMDRKSEAYELVRLGLKNDLKSHVCWHVYGLLYRSDREYREAIKFAISSSSSTAPYPTMWGRWREVYSVIAQLKPGRGKESVNDFKAQMRDLEGFVETRQQLLTLKPNHRMNWIGFAVAQHLNFNGSKAVDILEAYEGTLEDDYPPDNERCEHGEMLLYKVDKLSYKEQEVSLLEKLGLFDEGEELYKKLLSMNPDNYRYYEGLQRCMGLYKANGQYSSDEIDRLEALYVSLSKQYNRSSAVKRIPLDFLSAEKFRLAAENYIRPFLTKGVPSLFSDLSPLYDHSGKADILEQLILEMEHSLKETVDILGGNYCLQLFLFIFCMLLYLSKRLYVAIFRVDKEPPSTLMWTLFYLAQTRHYDVALRKIDEAIDHTPTVIDLYSVKSRILKHAGDSVAAAALADEARCMDLADRYVNSECVKRMLQADQVALAEKTAVLFTKDGEQHNNLHDMQCMWYELASGESYLRQGDLGRALKKFLAVEKHYADITEDQFDFHSYCLRKMTLRTYVEMLKFQDRLHSHSYFRKAAAGAIRCYLKLYDSPSKSSAEEDEEMSKLPPSQKKKLRQKQRKAEARAKKEAEVKEESNATAVSRSGKRQVKPVDLDPHGEKLLQVEDPLVEATKYLKLLQKHSSDSLETHLLSFEVNMRKQKILLALQAVKHLLRLDADDPDTHRCLIKFFTKVGSMPAPVTDTEKLIWGVLEAERPTISQLHGKSLIEANTLFLEKHRDSLRHRAAVAEMIFVMEPKKKKEAINLIEESSSDLVSPKWRLKDCIAVHKLLGTILDDHDAASRWKVRCADYFPHSTYFEGSHSSAVAKQMHKQPENGSNQNTTTSFADQNGNVDKTETALKDLVLQ
ncbi:hypothetical protein DH2020_041362 [Rehmannia glutinosa]|uniref:Uncharacterized protein n=1 Tax=Rehmannia glutinosa TaxID=99300 RepID=A0ABR0USC4_REHGL